MFAILQWTASAKEYGILQIELALHYDVEFS